MSTPEIPTSAVEWVWWNKGDGIAVGPRNKGALAIVFTVEEAQALCKEANDLARQRDEVSGTVRVPVERLTQLRVRVAENCTNEEALAYIDAMLAAAPKEDKCS